MRAEYAYLLEDTDVRRWFDNLAAKSLLMAFIYLRNFGLYCDLNKTDRRFILKVARTKLFGGGFTNFVKRLELEGKAGSHIARFKKTLDFLKPTLNFRLLKFLQIIATIDVHNFFHRWFLFGL